MINRFSPIILWIMLILLPVTVGKVIFSSAIDMERQLSNSRVRQKLGIELQKYNSALDPKTFICNALDSSNFSKILTALYKGQDMAQEYKKHPFLGGLPDFSGPVNDEIEKVATQFKSFIGVRPDIIYVFAPDEKNCGWHFREPFALPCDAKIFRSALKNSLSKLVERLKFREDLIPGVLRYQTEEPVLSKAMGLFDFIPTSFGIGREHFSSQNNAVLFECLLPILDAKGDFSQRFVLAAVSAASLDPRFILKKVCKNLNRNGIKHSFGTSQNSLLPAFNEENGQLALIGETPESFRKQAWKINLSNNRQLAIRISSSNQAAEAAFKSSMASFLLLLYAMAATFIFAGIGSGKFGNFQSIHSLVATGLFAGILLPISGAIWLGICYLNTQKQLEAEEILDWMRLKIFAKDQAIKMQLSRNLLFRNIFADIAAKMPVEKLKLMNQLTRYFELEGPEGLDSKINPKLENQIFCYALYHPELEDIVGKSNSKTKITETMSPFFGGHARETLFQLGALNYLSGERISQIMLKSQMTTGFLDKVIDKKSISKTFAEEKSAVTNVLSSAREHVTACFWRNQKSMLTGLSLIQSASSCWATNFVEILNANMIEQEFFYNGYRVFIHFYLTSSYGNRKLSNYSLCKKTQTSEKELYYRQLAEAIFSLSDTASVNNLDTNNPHMLSASTAADGETFIMAIAEPAGNNGLVSDKTLISLVALFAISCSLVLARGLSWALLRPISSFQVAIGELKKQNYNWQLDLKSGDEFDQLAASFNQMAVKLHEKAKISQLVSRNVMDAISSDNAHRIKPGGSRVDASILFADIRGFTTITENHSPEKVVDMLNDYFSVMAEIIEKNGGMIDKLIGDAIQAVFYAHENKNCAESAAKAGLEMRIALADFNQQRLSQSLFTIDNGVGICTGNVICGLVGSEHGMLDATIVGNLVNQAARFESLSKQGTSSKVIIDEATSKALPAIFQRHELKLNDSTTVTELLQQS